METAFRLRCGQDDWKELYNIYDVIMKMTLAELYDHLYNSTNFFNEGPEEQLALIKGNPILSIEPEELQYFVSCMTLNPIILRRTKHSFAVELWASYDEGRNLRKALGVMDWLANKLVAYKRLSKVSEIKSVMHIIVRHRVVFEDVTLQDAILEVLGQGITPARQKLIDEQEQERLCVVRRAVMQLEHDEKEIATLVEKLLHSCPQKNTEPISFGSPPKKLLHGGDCPKIMDCSMMDRLMITITITTTDRSMSMEPIPERVEYVDEHEKIVQSSTCTGSS